MKKIIYVILVSVFAFFLLIIPVSAEEVNGFSAAVYSDVSGYDYNDFDKLITVNTEHVKFADSGRSNPVQINDYVGNVYLEKMKPGRTYYISYSFVTDDGYTVPELTQENTAFTCDKGCIVWWCLKAYGVNAAGEACDCISVYEEVTVQGNFFQMLFGRIADFVDKVLAWSPY